MVEQLSGLGRGVTRISPKREISMEIVHKTEANTAAETIDSLKQLRADVERAFGLMGEVRTQLEAAYRGI